MENVKNNESWKTFVYNVKWLRGHYEFSEERMAEILGISVDMLKQIECGDTPEELDCEIILRIHNFFGIDAVQIWRKLSQKINKQNV